jgi:hypothetical protein
MTMPKDTSELEYYQKLTIEEKQRLVYYLAGSRQE